MPRKNHKIKFRNKRQPFTTAPKGGSLKGGYSGYVVQRDDPRAKPPVTYHVATVTIHNEVL